MSDVGKWYAWESDCGFYLRWTRYHLIIKDEPFEGWETGLYTLACRAVPSEHATDGRTEADPPSQERCYWCRKYSEKERLGVGGNRATSAVLPRDQIPTTTRPWRRADSTRTRSRRAETATLAAIRAARDDWLNALASL